MIRHAATIAAADIDAHVRLTPLLTPIITPLPRSYATRHTIRVVFAALSPDARLLSMRESIVMPRVAFY